MDYSDRQISLTQRVFSRRSSTDCWVPHGKSCTIHGVDVPGGMIYVGSGLASAQRDWEEEPALIDPSLAVRHAPPTEPMGYWPSYSRISPEHRRAYLRWLADGRRGPCEEIGYAFLFLYGLERRALHDARADELSARELPVIRREVAALLASYGSSNRSFQSYAEGFVDVLDALTGAAAGSFEPPPPPPDGHVSTFAIQRVLAHCAATGERIPVEWALAWMHTEPGATSRTAATRCRDEFDALFRLRYAELRKGGVYVKPCKRTVAVAYRPASSGLSSLEVETGLPNIMALAGPRRRLQELATECCDDLDSYSRFVGKTPERRDSLNALALMPPDLARLQGAPAIGQVRKSLSGALDGASGGVFTAADLLERWVDGDISKLGKRESVPLIQLIEHAGYGIEPDVRFGGVPLGKTEHVSVFRIPEDAPHTASSAYGAAALMIHLGAAVSNADGELDGEEERHLQAHLAKTLHLDEAERLRLGAHLQWLLVEPTKLTGMKKRVATLDARQRREAARLMVDVAWADGSVDPSEVKALQRIYKLLELDPESVHEDLHAAPHRVEQADAPVVVRPARAPASKGYAIPPRPEQPAPAAPAPTRATPQLDEKRIAAKLQQTAAVSSLLATIFVDDERQPVPEPSSTGSDAGGMAPELRALLTRLGEKPSWERDEYESLAEDLGLMPEGAFEMLNELAFDECDEALLEGDDPIDVDPDIYKELTA